METYTPLKPVKRLNATLPDALAEHVALVTSGEGVYETPSEYVRDLIRHHMQKINRIQQQEIDALLLQAKRENNYTPLTEEFFDDLEKLLEE